MTLENQEEKTKDRKEFPEGGLGSPKVFGRRFTNNRLLHNSTQGERGKKSQIDPTVMSRIERGEQLPPQRFALIDIMDKLELPESEEDELLVFAGYMPFIPNLNDELDILILVKAVRELIRPDAPKGYIQLLQDRIKNLNT